ncbi:MAG: YqgE/AlgH family protein, partial [Deltaproteobacteria bacterium]|nr:YqgE/AlgH family protein [Deltaproteobacteria bacterium]
MSPLAPGLLVAAPPLSDPNFDRSVVLLAAHGTEGAFGWVVNGRRLMSLDELFEQSDLAVVGEAPRGEVRIGGPVGREQIWLVYRSEDRIPGEPDQIEV